ncbi:MAG: ATP-binding protein [Acetatifactor sp.]
MKQFIGRDKELGFLEQYYEKAGSHIVVVYGGKGVGKTSLLLEFCKKKKWSYYLARACSDREQCCQWRAELSEHNPEISEYPDYRELIALSLSKVEAEKKILIIDEFHHMLKTDTCFFDCLAEFKSKQKESNPVMFLLCTSASGWVENHLVSRLKGAAASIDSFLKIRELKFQDIRNLYPGYSTEDCIRGYAVLGGTPGRWNSFDTSLSVKENIIHHLLDKNSRLYEEMEGLLEQQLREPGVYNTILMAMAGDCNKLNDIHRHTSFSRAKISVYLKNLMEMDLVEKVFSFDTAGRDNAKKGIYRIANAYVRFYFRYLFPNKSMLEILEPEEFYDKYIGASLDNFAEEAYRSICGEEMGRDYRIVSEWLGKTGVIDIVASDGRGGIGLACCSFSKKMEYRDLERLFCSMKEARLESNDIRLYSEKGFDEALFQKSDRGLIRLCEIQRNKGR